jgi:hypothetical protein
MIPWREPSKDPRASKPGIQVHHISSYGVSGRICGWKSGRTHHLLSKLERQWFYILEWSPIVADIREQFPLELEETQNIATSLKIRHPRRPKDEADMVMTTDFLVTNLDGSSWALSVKPSAELSRSRTAEKLEIERLYWSQRNIKYQIGSERELPAALIRNIEWVHPYLQIEDSPPVVRAVAHEINQRSFQGVPLREACLNTDHLLGLPLGTSLKITKHLIATKVLPVEMNQILDPSNPLPIKPHEFDRQQSHRVG